LNKILLNSLVMIDSAGSTGTKINIYK